MNKKNLTIIFILFLITIIFTILFLSYGITESNFSFFMPRRIKKITSIIICAICIGYTSVTFQTITNNNILTPSIIGLESLYMFIQTIIVFKWGSGQLVAMSGLRNYFLSLALMIIFSSILFSFMFKRGNNIYKLILLGIVIGSFFGGLSTFMQVLLDPNEFLILQGKMFASFNNINTDLLNISIILTIIILLITIKDLKIYDVLSLGRDLSINLGVNYKSFTKKSLIITSILISISTALVGPITFLGIILVSLSRYLANTYKHLPRILIAILIGTSSLLGSQFLIEHIFNFSLTISVIINFIGGIYFILLILREAKE